MFDFSLSGASPLVLVLALIIAAFLWMEGYRLYRLAVFFLGFLTGFTLSAMILKLIPSIPAPALVVQVVAGLLMGAASFMVLKLGLFIAAACASFLVLSNILHSLSTVGVIIAFAAAVVAGFIATKADKPVIIVLTGIVGGFALPSILLQLITLLPYDTGFLPPERSLVWIIVKVLLSGIGIAIQFSKVKDKD